MDYLLIENSTDQTNFLKRWGNSFIGAKTVSVEEIKKDNNNPLLNDPDFEFELILDYVMNLCQKGDRVITSSLLLISKSFSWVLVFAKSLNEIGVELISLSEEFSSQSSKYHSLLNDDVIEIIRVFDSSLALSKREKQRIGFERAKKEGKIIGKKSYKIDDYPNFVECYQKWARGYYTKITFAKVLGVSRPTLDKLITEYHKTRNKSRHS